MSERTGRMVLALAGGALLALCAGAASAQEASDEEIVVTAQRRAESIDRVPISMTAFNAQALETLGAQRPLELTAQTPNVGVFTIFGDSQQPSFSIRGIALLSFSDSFEPPVAMYLNDVYVGSGVGQSMQIFDIERVEVLRGPQGTLFGRNTTGGLFNIVTRGPTDTMDLAINAQMDSDNQVLADIAGGGPISDSVRFRIAGRYNDGNGWSRGFLDGRDYDTVHSVSVRGMLEADITESTQALLTVSHGESDQSTPGYGITGFLDPISGLPCSVSRIRTGACAAPSIGNLTGNDLGGFRPGVTPGQSAASFGVTPRQSVDVSNASLQVVSDLGGMTLTSITGYGELSKYYFEDLVLFSDGFTMDATQFTQEFRLNGGDAANNWVLGAYYFDDSKELGSFDPTPVFGFTTDADQETTSWALFGQARFALSERLGVSIGARYTDESKELHYTTDFGIDERREQSDGQWTGRVGVEFQMDPSTLLYANVSTGYKSGGFNAQFVFAPDGVDPVDPETITSYEAGVRRRFADGRGRFSAAAFYYDYQDVQLGLFVPLPGGGFATRLRNAGDAIGYGAEMELSYNPTEALSLTMGLGLIETEFQTSAIINSAGVLYDIKGHGLPMTPPVTVNGSINYRWPLTGGGELWTQLDGTWRDSHYFTTDESEREGSEAYGLLNIRAGWRAPGARYAIEAFVENVTDEEYLLFAADQNPDLGAVTWGRPRWAGVVVRARY